MTQTSPIGSTSGTGYRQTYISDPDEIAPASPVGNAFLWIMLAVAALVALFA